MLQKHNFWPNGRITTVSTNIVSVERLSIKWYSTKRRVAPLYFRRKSKSGSLIERRLLTKISADVLSKSPPIRYLISPSAFDDDDGDERTDGRTLSKIYKNFRRFCSSYLIISLPLPLSLFLSLSLFISFSISISCSLYLILSFSLLFSLSLSLLSLFIFSLSLS